MKVDTNSWNRVRYTLWAPLYDVVGRRFDERRRASLRLLDVKPGERVLIVGAGTGADLPYVPAGCTTVATDLTLGMLARARAHLRPGVHLAISDGHELAVRSGSCDAVVLHLVLAVVPDPVRCLRESVRALRARGRIAVFDKFTRSRRPSVPLRVLNVLTSALATHVTRRFEDILEESGVALAVEHDRPATLGGFFRHILLRKPPA